MMHADRPKTLEFDQVYQSLYPVIYRIAYRMSGDASRAEDVCHEAFIRYFQRPEPLPDLDQAKYWLIRVARNVSLNHAKKRFREARAYQRFKNLGPQHASSGEEETIRSETRTLVQQALQQLPASLRSVLVLKEYANLSYREIAKILGITEGNVKIRVFRARDRLSKILARTVR